MTSTSDLLLKQTRRYFPRFEDEQVEITPIEKGGSDRRFYRVRSSADHSVILVKYNLERGENRHYVQIAEFLSKHGIRAPKIYFHDPTEGLIWIEDLGEADLWSYRGESWPVRRSFYQSALEEVARLHCLPISEADHLRKDFPPEFDAHLYTWEQHYFFENCLGGYFKVDEKVRAELAALPILQQIAERLAALPRVLIHRDFQSQNIMVRDGQAHLIDFQGMRPGVSKYDLASLLYDPYVNLSLGERQELFAIYRELRAGFGCPLRVDDEEILRLCAVQRLMQALGFYGFAGTIKGNKTFPKYIPAGIESLRTILGTITGAEKLETFLNRLNERA